MSAPVIRELKEHGVDGWLVDRGPSEDDVPLIVHHRRKGAEATDDRPWLNAAYVFE